MTLLVIEHDIPLIMGLSDRIVAMDAGTGDRRGSRPQKVRSDPKVVEAYLGGTHRGHRAVRLAIGRAEGGAETETRTLQGVSFSREEIEEAFERYKAKVVDITADRDWSPFADLFTEDARYVEHLFGEFEGREAIRAWITNTMSRFPGNVMTGFPVEWQVIDAERGWVICKIWNDMPDPGDGKRYSAYNLTVLHYAGDGLWSYEEDAYNPATFEKMIRAWNEAKR